MIPSGFGAFLDATGASPHPSDWSPEQLAAYRAWRLAKFKSKWKFLRDSGDIALRYAAGQRWDVILEIRRELESVLGPAPSRVWRACACHRVYGMPRDGNPVQEQRASNPFIWQGVPAGKVALAWLDANFGPEHERV